MQLTADWPTFHDLMTAYRSCRLGKPAGASQINFEMKLGANLAEIHKHIHAKKYKPLPAKCFVVTHPKPREIFAADFRDRVVHHLVVSQLGPIWERKFIHSSFACRINHGTHGAIKYAQTKVRSLSRGGLHDVWCLQLDITKFFVSIDRAILRDLLLKTADHHKLRELIQIIYNHDARFGVRKNCDPRMFSLIPMGKSWFDQPLGVGLPIGNLTSQFGANVYLTELDHYIQRTHKPGAYRRYMDDLMLLDCDPDKLKTVIEPIDDWIRAKRKQQLNTSKTKLTRLQDGINYLGYELRQTNSASQPLQLFSKPAKQWKFIRAIRKFEQAPFTPSTRPHPLSPVLTNEKLANEISSVNSHMGTLIHANTYLFRKKALRKLCRNTRDQRGIPVDLAPQPWTPYKIKEGYSAITLK
jgi:retron-type reverse transcriptase